MVAFLGIFGTTKKIQITSDIKILSPIYLNDYIESEKNILKFLK